MPLAAGSSCPLVCPPGQLLRQSQDRLHSLPRPDARTGRDRLTARSVEEAEDTGGR